MDMPCGAADCVVLLGHAGVCTCRGRLHAVCHRKGSDENIRNAYVVIDGKTGETESVAEEEASAGADTDAGEASSAGADTAAGEEDDAGTTADVGGAANAKDNPSTGDFSLPEKLFFLLILSGTAVCGLLTKRTRKKKRRFN